MRHVNFNIKSKLHVMDRVSFAKSADLRFSSLVKKRIIAYKVKLFKNL